MSRRNMEDEAGLVYLDDLRVGQRFVSGTHQVDAAQIKAFAAQFDPQPFHLDEAAADQSVFAGLAASGWHTAAMAMRLMVEGGPRLAGGLIGGGGELNWPRPVRPGDVLHVECEVLAIRHSASRPDRGIVTMLMETRNQHDEVVQSFTGKLIVLKRPAGEG